MSLARIPREDRLYLLTLLPAAAIVLGALAVLAAAISWESLPAVRHYGPGLFTGREWRPSELEPGRYGLLPPLLGTIVVALLAVALSLPAVAALPLLTEELAPRRLRGALSGLVDVMAGLPTVIYGLWGLAFIVPLVRRLGGLLGGARGVPLLSCSPGSGASILAAGILLSVMITPFAYSIVREAYRSTPWSLVEASHAYAPGWAWYARLRLSMIRPAVLGALLLGFGRAAGETVAVALVVGNSYRLPTCLLGPGYTISSLIANQFANSLYYPLMGSALYSGGLALLLIGLATSIVGLRLIERGRSIGSGR